jgi:hypothetical protein
LRQLSPELAHKLVIHSKPGAYAQRVSFEMQLEKAGDLRMARSR